MRSRRHAIQRVQRDHFKDQIELAAGTGCKLGRGPVFDGKQTDEVHRIVGRRIPLGQTVRLDAVEPAGQPLCRDFRLLFAGAAGSGEHRVWQISARQQLRGMEAEHMVLAPEPHDVVTRFVHPIAIVDDRSIDPCDRLDRQSVAIGAHQPEKRHEHEIGAVLAPVDRLQCRIDDAVNGYRVIAAGSDQSKRTPDTPGTELGAEGKRRPFPLRNVVGSSRRKEIGHEGGIEDAGNVPRPRPYRHLDAMVTVGNADRLRYRQRRLSGSKNGFDIGKNGMVMAMACNHDMDRQGLIRCAIEHQLQWHVDEYIACGTDIAHQGSQAPAFLLIERHRQNDDQRRGIGDFEFEKPDDVTLGQVLAQQQDFVVTRFEAKADIEAAFDVANEWFEAHLLHAVHPDAYPSAGRQPQIDSPRDIASERSL
ncbi:hypothetical protein D3C80_494740 [compost metagenome]